MTTRAPFPYEPPNEQSGPGGPDGGGGPGAGGPRPRRSRAMRLLPLAAAGWVVLEIWLLMLLADATSGLVVLLVLVAGFVLGAAAVKRAGRRAWQNLAETVQRAQDQARAGGVPDEESPASAGKGGGNGMAMLGGLLIMIPGLLSDAAGLLCLFPPTAKLLRAATRRTLERPRAHTPGTLGDAYQQARSAEEQIRMHRPDGKVVQGEVVRDDEPPAKG